MNSYTFIDNKLIFNDEFNEPIIFIDNINNFDSNNPNHLYFPNVKIIKFGKYFNQNIDNINFPNTITHIYFGNNFNQNIDNIKWPQSLLYLSFGKYFNPSKIFDNNNIIKKYIFPIQLEQIIINGKIYLINDNINDIDKKRMERCNAAMNRWSQTLTPLKYKPDYNKFQKNNLMWSMDI